MVSLLPSLSTPGILTCSIAPHCGHCPFKPPPILHQQKLHSPIKVDLKCSLFHEVLPDPPIHRDSASFGHLWDFAHIYLVTLVTHRDSQLGYVCVFIASLPLVKEVLKNLNFLFSLPLLCALNVIADFETKGMEVR